MKPAPQTTAGRGGLDLIGETVQLVRTAPLDTLAAHPIGTVPFILGLLYFWADMSRSPRAAEHAFGASLALAALFIWMKAWHAVFGAGLLAHLRGEPAPGASWRRGLRLLTLQAAWQPTGLLAIPVALLLLMPFPLVYGFYQNLSVIGDSAAPGLRAPARHAWRLATLWPRQHAVMLWLLSPWLLATGLLTACLCVWFSQQVTGAFTGVSGNVLLAMLLFPLACVAFPLSPLGTLVAVNLGALYVLLPYLLKLTLDIPTPFTLNGPASLLNTTFLLAVFGGVFVTLDPLLKAAYALRCFYGDALHTGVDLLAALRELAANGRRAAGLAGLALLLLLLPTPAARADGEPSTAHAQRATLNVPRATADGESAAPPAPPPAAQPPALTPTELDAAIRAVMQQPAYTWRAPRAAGPVREVADSLVGSFADHLRAWTERLFRWLGERLRDFFDWLRRLFGNEPLARPEGGDWGFGIRIFWFALAGVALSAAGVLAYRFWRRRGAKATEEAPVVTAVPDLASEEVIASQLPRDQWLDLADRFLSRGEYRLAIRALFLGGLAHLAQRNVLTIARYKSNREYRRELERRYHDHPEALAAFDRNLHVLEAVWYGEHPVSRPEAEAFARDQEQVVDDGA